MKKSTCLSVAVQAVFTLMCIFLTGIIFYNSIQTAEASSASSSEVVEIVQDVAAVVAPNSPISTATGDDYDILHDFIRKLAHFSEFAMLGCFLVWAWNAYTEKKRFLWIPLVLLVAVACADEILQGFIPGRATEFMDALLDISGGIVGGVVALLTVWLGTLWIEKMVGVRALNLKRGKK